MKEDNEVLGDFNPLIVHKRDPKTNRTVKSNPFRVVQFKGERFYEWPKGSANLWYENRKFAGRLGDDMVPVRGEPHKVWNPPVTEDQALGERNAALEMANRKLMQELNDIKREQEMDAKIAKADAKAAEIPSVKPRVKKNSGVQKPTANVK